MVKVLLTPVSDMELWGHIIVIGVLALETIQVSGEKLTTVHTGCTAELTLVRQKLFTTLYLSF